MRAIKQWYKKDQPTQSTFWELSRETWSPNLCSLITPCAHPDKLLESCRRGDPAETIRMSMASESQYSADKPRLA